MADLNIGRVGLMVFFTRIRYGDHQGDFRNFY